MTQENINNETGNTINEENPEKSINNDELNEVNIDTMENNVKKVQRPESNEVLFGRAMMSMRQGNFNYLLIFYKT